MIGIVETAMKDKQALYSETIISRGVAPRLSGVAHLA